MQAFQQKVVAEAKEFASRMVTLVVGLALQWGPPVLLLYLLSEDIIQMDLGLTAALIVLWAGGVLVLRNIFD